MGLKYLIHVTAMTSQLASKRLRWFISQHLESLTRSLPSQWKVNDCKWWTSSPTLEAHLSGVLHIDDEVNAGIAKASAVFGRLRASIWDRIRLDTKLKVYRSMVLPTLLYACETWTVYQRHAKRLNHFHTSYLRKLLKIKWQDRIPDTEVLKRAGMQSIHTLLKLAQLRLTGHVTRMPDERLPKKSSMENYKWGNAPIVVRRNNTRTPSKPLLKTST